MATKTDNHFLRDKIALRASHLPDGDVRVLDCYGGKGVVWRGVERLTGRAIKRLPIDIRRDIDTFRLAGDNESWLLSIDLSKFNVIDLDAYGQPIEQLQTIFERGYIGVVFVTFIQTALGKVHNRMLEDVGFTHEMVQKCPTLFARRGFEYFLDWLARHGVTSVSHRSAGRKHYLCFVSGAAAPASDSNILVAGTFADRV